MTDRLPRKLAAILYADVAGYSRLTGEDEDATHRTLSEYLDLISNTIQSHGGQVMHYAGDAALAKFDAVLDAMSAAVAIQSELNSRNQRLLDERKVHFRIGINLGDVIEDRGDVYGDGVNIAARLESLADPGGICISDAVRAAIGKKLDLDYEDLGEQEIKNIDRPVRVWRWSETGRAGPTVTGSEQLPFPDKMSIAVLPFVNLSGDPGQNYFVDGLVEDLTVSLGREKWLFVIASPSTLSLKNQAFDPRNIGSELGVRYVMQGSVRRDASRVRIVVKLSDGQSGGQIWSDRFEDEVDNVFDIQDRLVTQVVAAITPALRSSEIERAYRKPTKNLSAFDLYLQALPLFRTSLTDNQKALGLLDKAIALDRSYSSAYGLAARCYQFQKIMAWVPPADQCLEDGIQLAQRASELGKNDSEALWMAGLALVFLDGELDQGPALIERSLSLNPSSANAWTSSCLAHSCLGHLEIAIDHFRRAQRLNPLDQLHHLHWNTVGLAYLGADRFEEADVAADKTLNALPAYPPGLRLKVAACGLLDRAEESDKYLQRLLVVQPECSLTWMAEFLGSILRRNPSCFANYIEGARLAGLPENPPKLA